MKKLTVLILISLALTGCANIDPTDIGNREVLAIDAIRQIALNHSKLTQDDAVFDITELDDDAETYYVEVSDGTQSISYTIDAHSGKILNTDAKDVVTQKDDTITPTQNSQSNQTGDKKRLTKDQAIVFALKDAGLSRNDVTIKEVELDRDDGRLLYEIEFYSKNKEYDYDIDAYTGEVLKKDFDIEDFDIKGNTSTDIGLSKAKSIALAKVPGANNNHIKIEKDRDDGRIVYEGEIIYNEKEYEFEIDGHTGTIIEWEVESVYD